MLDVLSYVAKEKAKIKRAVERMTAQGKQPKIAIVTDDSNFDANASYIKSKTAFAFDVGVACDVIVLKGNEDIPSLDSYDGVIVQYPFRDFTFAEFRNFVARSIPVSKDIDGLGFNPIFSACTPLGIVKYIDHLRKTGVIGEDITVNIIGAGGLVGKPLVEMLMSDPRCTVCVTRHRTSTWVADNFEASADVVVCATPTNDLIKYPDLRKVYIDCGCNLVDGKLRGNVSRDAYGEEALITPVPGGVGRLTVLALFQNLLGAHDLNNRI